MHDEHGGQGDRLLTEDPTLLRRAGGMKRSRSLFFC